MGPSAAGLGERLLERGVAKQLVTRTHEEASFLRQTEQLVRLGFRLDERLLDVDVGAAEQCLPRNVEMRPGRRADVHDIRLTLREQRRHRAGRARRRPRPRARSRPPRRALTSQTPVTR